MKCIWCLKSEPTVAFSKKAHTIPKSLGGQNYNRNVCDHCNEYFGNKQELNYSIEEALKETFNITRQRLLIRSKTKRKVGRFKSRFFEIKERKGHSRLVIKTSFRFDSKFQRELCQQFKRGLYKMFLEEFNRQTEKGFEPKYDVIRNFARYGLGKGTVIYFYRAVGILITMKNEPETPVLFFDRMNYLYSNDKFIEIEFLGHVFGFPIAIFNESDFKSYLKRSIELKKDHFKSAKIIDRLLDIDFTLSIMDK
nr:HNH endonuclease [uncultured Allomuricauda sp.]